MKRLLSLVLKDDLAIKPETRAVTGMRWLATFEIALIVVTWPLWRGQSEFPAVPLTRFNNLFASDFMVGVLLTSCSLLAMFVTADRSRLVQWSAIFGFYAGVSVVIVNQHRLQPWHWLYLLNMIWLIGIPRKDLLCVMRHTVATVYVCSALSRISVNPDGGISDIIARQLLAFFGLRSGSLSASTISTISHVMTVGEFLVGVLLLLPKTRRVGCLAAVGLHVSLLLALGPLGLNHHAGVLLWNLCFAGLIPILFIGDAAKVVTDPFSLRRCLAIAVTWTIPLSGLIGIADNWPSWQLYSSRPETWILYVHEGDTHLLPQGVRSHIAAPAPLSEWCPVMLDRWSLEQTRSPMYPEDRFQKAVIHHVIRKSSSPPRIRVEISAPAVPFWWHREHRTVTDVDDL